MRLRHHLLLAFALTAATPALPQEAAAPADVAAPATLAPAAKPAVKPAAKRTPKPAANKPAAKLAKRPRATGPAIIDPTTPEANGWGLGQSDSGAPAGEAQTSQAPAADPSTTGSARPNGLEPCEPDVASEVRPSCAQAPAPPAPKVASENPSGCVVFTTEPASASQYPFSIHNRCRFAVEFRARVCTEDWTKKSQPVSCTVSPEPLYLSAGSGYSGHSDNQPARLVSACSARSGECMHAGARPARRKTASVPKPPA